MCRVGSPPMSKHTFAVDPDYRWYGTLPSKV
jgi:hypothetical protein